MEYCPAGLRVWSIVLPVLEYGVLSCRSLSMEYCPTDLGIWSIVLAIPVYIGTRLRFFAVELLSIPHNLCALSQCLFGTILLTLCNGKEQSQCSLVGLICSFSLYPTIFSFSFFHGLVVCGWGLRIDRVF